MNTTPGKNTLRRLAIAKEMYLQGTRNSEGKTSVNSILAVLNFDYSVETIIKTVLLDNNIPLTISTKKPNQFKRFDMLILDLQKFYTNNLIISEINNLHKLRNEVQHNTSIPSPQDINRHELNVRSFFDDICKNVYNTITFETISLAFLVDSIVEKTILKSMEQMLDQKNYDDALFYARKAVYYHRNLLLEEIDLPYRWGSARDFDGISSDRYGTRDLGRYLREIEKTIDALKNRLALQEYTHETKELFGNTLFFGDFRENTTQSIAERGRTLAYNIITGTQGWLKKNKDYDMPEIFDFHITKNEKNIEIIFGIASVSTIKNSKLEILSRTENKVEKTIQLSKNTGIERTSLENPAFYSQHRARIIVENEHGKSQDTATIP